MIRGEQAEMSVDNGQEMDQSHHDNEGKTTPKLTRNLKKLIHDSFDEIAILKQERKAINEQISAKMTDLVSKNLDRKGIKAALNLYELGEGDRTDRDLTFAICCRALGIKQIDMLEELEKEQDGTKH